MGADSPPQGAPSSTPPTSCLPTAVQFPPHPRGPGDDRLALPQIQALLSSCAFGGNKALQAKYRKRGHRPAVLALRPTAAPEGPSLLRLEGKPRLHTQQEGKLSHQELKSS